MVMLFQEVMSEMEQSCFWWLSLWESGRQELDLGILDVKELLFGG